MDERSLLDRLRRDDEGAFDSIFREHYATLVGFAESFLREREGAEDVAQEVMLELWRRRATFTIEISLRAYLLQSTRNRSLNRIRHEKIAKRLEPEIRGEESTDAVGISGIVEGELSAAFQAALGKLPPRCREVFELSRGQGLKYTEIAAALDISIKTVETQMGKALQILRKELAEWRPEE